MLYVPGLTKNLILVSTLEDKGYQVKFCDHRVYIRPKGSDRSLDRVISRRSTKVYRLHFEPARLYSAAAVAVRVSCGIRGWHTYTMELEALETGCHWSSSCTGGEA